MKSLDETAPAKLNLALHVRARRADGFHDIETLFAFCEDGDLLTAAPASELSLAVHGPFAAMLATSEDNLVLRAAQALRAAAGIAGGASITLDKRLPIAAGLGGGSADAAAALRLLGRLWRLAPDDSRLEAIARDLGSDIPACLASRTMRGEGRGERLTPVDGARWAGVPVLLVNPGVALSTPAVFARWDGVDRGALGDDPLAGRNDLEPAARAFHPAIGELLAVLRAQDGTKLVRMSGSGATCFALFASDEARDAAETVLRARHPDWWRLATRLR